MSGETIAGLIIALLSSGVILEIVRYFIDYYDRKSGFTKTLKVLSQLQNYIDGITEKTEGSRVSYIVATTSDNSDLSCYISILLDSADPPLKSVKRNYEKFKVDLEYIQMLSDLKVHKKIRVESSELSGMLQKIYKPSGITHSDIFLLDSGVDWCVFISINYVNGAENTMTQEQEKHIFVNKLRNVKLKKVSKNIKFHGQRLR